MIKPSDFLKKFCEKFYIHPYGLKLLRYGIAAIVFTDFLIKFLEAKFLFSDQGWLPNTQFQFFKNSSPCVLCLNDELWFSQTVFLIGMTACLSLVFTKYFKISIFIM